ncbi:MAG: hypothetical protein AAFV71_19345 [Cyanobacteria bacterium J06633_8]
MPLEVLFAGAWNDYGAEKFLNYESLGNGLFMINSPNCGNDYGEVMARLVESEQAKSEFFYECRNYSQNFAHFIQSKLVRRYRVAENVFPMVMNIPKAARMTAAICIQLNTQPRNLPVRVLQQALLNDARSPTAIVPLFNSLPSNPDWLSFKLYYLDNFHDYIDSVPSGNTLKNKYSYGIMLRNNLRNIYSCDGIFQRLNQQNYRFKFIYSSVYKTYIYQHIALNARIH